MTSDGFLLGSGYLAATVNDRIRLRCYVAITRALADGRLDRRQYEKYLSFLWRAGGCELLRANEGVLQWTRT